MTHEKSDDLAIPDGLSPLGRRAAEVIKAVLKEHETTYTGGCKAFYAPTQWRERGEEYGLGSELIVVYDGGDLRPFFSTDEGAWSLLDVMNERLGEIGAYAEACTAWYSAIYPTGGAACK